MLFSDIFVCVIERVAELELAVKDLESQLAEQDEAANGVIEKWQESYAALETQNSELASSLEAPASAGETASSDCPDDSASSNAALQLELEQTKSALAEVEAKLVDDDNVVVKWEGKPPIHRRFSCVALFHTPGDIFSNPPVIFLFCQRTSCRTRDRCKRLEDRVERTRGKRGGSYQEVARELQCS